MAPAAIEFSSVNKWFGKLHVLRDISLSVAAGEVVVVCGPSGSGKSTLIRTVNGLERVQEGDIVVLGDSITPRGVNLPALRTRAGMVFQSFNLFPHMTALENIMLAPQKVRKLSRVEAEEKALRRRPHDAAPVADQRGTGSDHPAPRRGHAYVAYPQHEGFPPPG